jgi:hypothetical protein
MGLRAQRTTISSGTTCSESINCALPPRKLLDLIDWERNFSTALLVRYSCTTEPCAADADRQNDNVIGPLTYMGRNNEYRYQDENEGTLELTGPQPKCCIFFVAL